HRVSQMIEFAPLGGARLAKFATIIVTRRLFETGWLRATRVKSIAGSFGPGPGGLGKKCGYCASPVGSAIGFAGAVPRIFFPRAPGPAICLAANTAAPWCWFAVSSYTMWAAPAAAIATARKSAVVRSPLLGVHPWQPRLRCTVWVGCSLARTW